MPNIDALNSDTHTLRIRYEYTQKQCVVVANEGIFDIWGLLRVIDTFFSKSYKVHRRLRLLIPERYRFIVQTHVFTDNSQGKY